jgi:hypothetical protein
MPWNMVHAVRPPGVRGRGSPLTLGPAPLEPLGAQADLLLHRLHLGGEALESDD